MYPFVDENIRNKISNILNHLNEIPNRHKITINDIDILLEHISQKSSTATNLMIEKATNELSIGYFGSLIISLTALKLADKLSPQPIDSNWLFPENVKANPNLVLESLLVNVANQSFSIMNLATLGYAWPARIIFRSTLELTWLTLILVSEREKMLLYCKNASDKEERALFSKHFSGSKLQQSLTGIEQKLQFAEDQKLMYSNFRSEAYTLFTKHVHNSFAATILGTRAPSIDNPQNFEYALFNTPSIPSINIISSLNQQVLFYLIGTLLPILKIYHSFDAVSKWDELVTLRECFVQLYVNQKI